MLIPNTIIHISIFNNHAQSNPAFLFQTVDP